MKKIIAFILSIVLILVMTTSSFAFVFDAKSVNIDEDDKTINYVALGASQSFGFGSESHLPEQFSNWYGTEAENWLWNNTPDEYKYLLPSWNPYDVLRYELINYDFNNNGVDVQLDNCYSSLIKKSMEDLGYTVNLSQLALKGMRSTVLFDMLNGDIGEETIDFLIGCWNNLGPIMDVDAIGTEAAIQGFCEKYVNAVKEADFITYDLGAAEVSNGIGKIFGVWARDNTEHANPDYERILDENDYQQFKVIREALIAKVDKFLDLSSIDSETAMPIRNLIDQTAYGMLSYCAGMDKIMDIIYEWNPDVCITVIQIQNFYAGQSYTLNGTEVPLGDIIQAAVDILNTYASSFSKHCNEYYFARVTDDQRVEFNYDLFKAYTGDPETITDMMKFILDVSDEIFDIHVKSMYTAKYEALLKNRAFIGLVGDSNYQQGLTASYDACMELLAYIINNYKCDLANFGDGSADAMEPLIDTMIASVAEICLTKKDEDYSVAIEAAKAAFDALDPADQSYIAMVFLNQFGATIVVHPSAKGQQQMAQGIINAFMTENKGVKSMLGGIMNAAKSFKNTADSIAACIDEIVGSIAKDPAMVVSSVVPIEKITTSIKQTVQKQVSTTLTNISSQLKQFTRPMLK